MSHQVVSKTLNGGRSNSGASAATQEKIRKAAQKLGYRPSAVGMAMRRGCTNSVGVLVGSSDDFLLPQRTISRLVGGLSRAGYTCTLHSVLAEAPKDLFLSPLLSEVHADCLLVSYVRAISASERRRVEALGTPVIWMNQRAKANAVAVDEAQGARLLAEHLQQAGCGKILFVDYSADSDAPFFRERLDAVKLFCAEHDIPFEMIHRLLPRKERSAHAECWLKSVDRGTGVIVNSLAGAQVVCQTALRLGIGIPGDISVCSFDSGDWHMANCPAITCAVRSDEDFGDVAAGAVLEKLRDPSASCPSILLPFRLSQGGTTRSSNQIDRLTP